MTNKRFTFCRTIYNPGYGPQWMVWDEETERFVFTCETRDEAREKAKRMNEWLLYAMTIIHENAKIDRWVQKNRKRYGDSEEFDEKYDAYLQKVLG